MSRDDLALVAFVWLIATAVNTCGLTDSIDNVAAAIRAQKCGKP